jgi:glycosyltransferase involved in cell wall biosynthesis
VLASLPRIEPMLLPQDFIPAGRKLLLGVGRLDSGKQFDHLIDAFAVLRLRYPSWILVIIGEGTKRLELSKQIHDLEMDRQILLLGRAGNLQDWYCRADLFAMCSRFEGFPNTLAEAMSFGCAAISYDCDTGPRDIIKNEVNGLLVSPVGDVSKFTNALDRLMGNSALREQMAAQARMVREQFSIAKTLTNWDSLFEAVITR